MVEPKPYGLWPFVHLLVLDETHNQTSDVWWFLPVEILREATDGIPEGAKKVVRHAFTGVCSGQFHIIFSGLSKYSMIIPVFVLAQFSCYFSG